MLHLSGRGQAHTCDGVTRRDFLQVGTLGAIGLSLPDLLAAKAQGAVAKDHDERSVIMIFNLGAPSQLDLFDMKPDAPVEIRGPFKPIKTKAPGIEISEILPLHAQHADKFSLVRSCYHTAAAVHDTGHQMMQTGRLFTGGINTPHAGCALSYLRGRRSDLPAHVVLPEPMGPTGGNLPHGQDAGFLGKAHDPFALMADPSKPNFKVPDLLPPPEIGEVRLERRRKLRSIVDETVDNFEASDNAQLLDSNFEAAFRMMTSPQGPRRLRPVEGADGGSRALRHEPLWPVLPAGAAADRGRRAVRHGQHVPDRVRRDHLGHSRLEAVHVDRGHEEHRRADVRPGLYARCSKTLSQRGMLDNTLVCNLAEFGRTPRVNPAGGRDHWPQCWTVYFAGGGVQGGRVVGMQRSDRRRAGRAAGRAARNRGHDLPQPGARPGNQAARTARPAVPAGRLRQASRFTNCFKIRVNVGGGGGQSHFAPRTAQNWDSPLPACGKHQIHELF